MNIKRISALIGVIIIFLMYLATLILAVMGSEKTVNLFLLSILCTIMVPLIIHLFLMLNNARHGKSVMDEPYPYKEKEKDR
ncbi:MAG: hypothetical protein IJ805_08220 [Lachnospiraceae bacterium]|nr:hypothetical protein [Lachnospiraceae bacterium]